MTDPDIYPFPAPGPCAELITDRAAAVAVLKAARGFLWDGVEGAYPGEPYSVGLCWCVLLAVRSSQDRGLNDASEQLRKLISFRLEGATYLRGWLIQQGYGPNFERPAIQATRRAWLESLIEEHS